MKKTLALILTLALSLAALTGCGSKTETPADTNTDSSAQTEAPAETTLSGSVSTNGSTSMEKVIGTLSEQFMTDNSGVTVTYDPTGSGAGIEAAGNGSADIGLSSRALKDEEKAGGLTETVVALDGIAVIVNANSKVEDLTVEQIAKIFTGEITDWSEVGGDAGTISCIGREAGSGTGIEAAANGTADIGLSSRALTEEETASGLVGTEVALDGIAVIVNADSPVADLSVEQIAQIFTGEITNWSELGGADAEIAVFGREAGSGTRDGFESITGTEEACVYQNEYTSTGEVVAGVASNPNAIGYASLSAVDESVVAVEVNGVAPSEATVADGTYEIQRPFVMVTKEGTQLSEAAQAFLDFAMSADAAEIIAVAGAVSANA